MILVEVIIIRGLIQFHLKVIIVGALFNLFNAVTIRAGAYSGGALGPPLPPLLNYKVIYISSQRNSGNRTCENVMTFFLVFA